MERSRLGCFTDGEEPRRRRGRGPLATILGVCLRLGPLRPALMVIPSLRLGRCVGGSCLAICMLPHQRSACSMVASPIEVISRGSSVSCGVVSPKPKRCVFEALFPWPGK